MKKYLILLALLFPSVLVAEGTVVDPSITPTWTVTCVYPIQREDGSVLDVTEIAQVEWKVSSDNKLTWSPAGTNNLECKQVYNLAAVPDGQYYYSVLAVDTEGRVSQLAYDADPLEVSALVVKRLANPSHPTGVIGIAQ